MGSGSARMLLQLGAARRPCPCQPGRRRAWAERLELVEQLEEKPASVALHWRGLPPERIAELQAAAPADWSALAGLEVHLFDGGI